MSVTDIIVTTRSRPEYLEKTLSYIFNRTRSSYTLHVIDDNSQDNETVPYLLDLYNKGLLASLTLRNNRCGAMANLNVGYWLAFSDPMVFTDDDVLCPEVEPDWLQQGLEAMRARSKLGLLALNHPGALRHRIDNDDKVTYCKFVGGTFMFVRRAVFKNWHLPHFRDNFGTTPTVKRCNKARNDGWQIGYLTNVYCEHIGKHSAITNGEYAGRFIEPVNKKTLEPMEEKWRK